MDTNKTALLFGPYRAPALKKGDRALCLYRDAEVIVFGWHDALISWPLCYRAGTRAAGKGLLVDEELARAVRHESATAMSHWWGVSQVPVNRWRAALGVGRMDAEGSRRLIHGAALGGLNARRKRQWPMVRLWSAEDLALLATLSDAEVARLTSRSPHAVAKMRKKLRSSGL